MGVNFPNSGDRVSIAAEAAIDSLDVTSHLFIVNPNQITLTNRRLLYKVNSSIQGFQIFAGQTFGTPATGKIRYFHDRATTGTDFHVAGGTFAVGTWYFIAVIDDPTDQGNTGRVMIGEYGSGYSGLNEASYDTQTLGSGAAADDSTGAESNLAVGGRNAGAPSNWNTAFYWMYNVALTNNQLLLHMWRPETILSGCLVKLDLWNTTYAAINFGNQGVAHPSTVSGNNNVHAPVAPRNIPLFIKGQVFPFSQAVLIG